MYCGGAFYDGGGANVRFETNKINNYSSHPNAVSNYPPPFYFYNQGYSDRTGTGKVTFGCTYPEVTSLYQMFYRSNINSPVQQIFSAFPNLDSCQGMFLQCENFNQPVSIPSGVINCEGMFSSCSNFNQSVTIGNSVTNCAHMFSGCSNLNKAVTIGSHVENCVSMFYGCNNFHPSEIQYVPGSVTNCTNMFATCFTKSSLTSFVSPPHIVFNDLSNIPSTLIDVTGRYKWWDARHYEIQGVSFTVKGSPIVNKRLLLLGHQSADISVNFKCDVEGRVIEPYSSDGGSINWNSVNIAFRGSVSYGQGITAYATAIGSFSRFLRTCSINIDVLSRADAANVCIELHSIMVDETSNFCVKGDPAYWNGFCTNDHSFQSGWYDLGTQLVYAVYPNTPYTAGYSPTIIVNLG